jgi:hypothetical protein
MLPDPRYLRKGLVNDNDDGDRLPGRPSQSSARHLQEDACSASRGG